MKDPNLIPGATEFAQKRAWFAQHGVDNATFTTIYGAGPNGATRSQAAQYGIEHQKNLPKAEQ